MAKANKERMFKKINYEANEIKQFLKEQNHRYFKTYAPMSRIEQIISEKCFYLSDGSNWNDKVDRDRFMSVEDGKKRYGKCFATEMKESIAMWMLYGGREYMGGMLSFTKMDMEEIRSYNKRTAIELGSFQNGRFVKHQVIDGSVVECSLSLIDILYFEKKNTSSYRVRTRNAGATEIGEEVLKQIWNRKSAAWDYEDECRLVLEINDDHAPDNSAGIMEHRNDWPCVAKIRIPDSVITRISNQVYCAPNFRGDITQKKYIKSSLTDEVDWDLCHGCSKNV